MCSQFRQKVKTCYMFSKTCYMFSPLPPIGGHKNFFGTRDLHQSISRARKPPSTKNQFGEKFFETRPRYAPSLRNVFSFIDFKYKISILTQDLKKFLPMPSIIVVPMHILGIFSKKFEQKFF